jgi:hypothetical protein
VLIRLGERKPEIGSSKIDPFRGQSERDEGVPGLPDSVDDGDHGARERGLKLREVHASLSLRH